MVEAVQNAMNKASSHMEDSVLASYFALLIGCLLLQNEVCFLFNQFSSISYTKILLLILTIF